MDVRYFGVRYFQSFLIEITHSIFHLLFSTANLCLLIVSFNVRDHDYLRKQLLDGAHNSVQILCVERALMIMFAIAAGIWSVNKGLKYIILTIGLCGTIMMYTLHLFVRAYSWHVLFVAKVIFNIMRGFVVPLIYGIIPKWVINNEKGRHFVIIYSGKVFASVIECLICFYLIQPNDEWEMLLFWCGNFIVLWSILWWGFASNHPKTCFYISKNERKYIQENQPDTLKFGGESKKIPWNQIFMTFELYPLMFCHACLEWSNDVAYGHLQSYLIFIYDQKLEVVSKLLMIGDLVSLIIAFPIGYLVDKVANKTGAVSKVRKVATCVGMWGSATTIAFLGPAPNLTWAKIMCVLNMIFIPATHAGFYITFLDHSPNFGSLVFSISSCFSYFVTLWVQPLRQILLKSNSDREGWNNFLYTAWLSNYLGGLVYALFTTADTKIYNKIYN